MEVAALIAWAVQALLGVTLLTQWLRGGGFRQPQDESDPGGRPGVSIHLLVPHAVLALAGLVIWTVFTFRSEGLGMSYTPGAAAIALVVVIALGLAMFRRWWRSRRWADIGGTGEARMHPAVVLAHGVGAAATLALVLVNVFVG